MILGRLHSIALYSIENIEELKIPPKYQSIKKESFMGFSAATNMEKEKIKNIKMKKLKPNEERNNEKKQKTIHI